MKPSNESEIEMKRKWEENQEVFTGKFNAKGNILLRELKFKNKSIIFLF